MKLINLNVWGGSFGKELDEFLTQQANLGVDIFCFQEVFAGGDSIHSNPLTNFRARRLSLFNEISAILPDYQGFFCSVQRDVYGIACFVKKDIKVVEVGDEILFENKKFPDPEHPEIDHTRKMQWLQIERGGEEYLVINLHGYRSGKGKTDTPERLKQSEVILVVAQKFALPTILCGDFNLRPDTDSIRMLEKSFEDLIVKNGITSTRNHLYKKPEQYADYMFTSPEIKVVDFKVLPDVCSDHAPLFLEFK